MDGSLVAVHGGAGAWPRERIEPGLAALARAAAAGLAVLTGGGSAVDAAVEAVRLLEDDPLFNAGTGAVLTGAGTVELDAGVMDGATGEVGAVALVRHVRSPVLLARVVLDLPQAFMVGTGAERLAERAGVRREPARALVWPGRREQWRQWRQWRRGAAGGDTVGAVARDAAGNLAVAGSTGGTLGKPPGRVGDTPVPGAGFWAGVRGAAVGSGLGEDFLRTLPCFRAARALEADVTPTEAATEAMRAVVESASGGQGTGGLLVLGRSGMPAAVHTSRHLPHAWVAPGASGVAATGLALGDQGRPAMR